MTKYTCEIPVLFIVFNRPEKTELSLKAIAKVKPKKIYISADGPRIGVESDIGKIKKVRDIINNKIDWPCKIYKHFNKDNLGCKNAPITALKWFFTKEEKGIILEDDCLPSVSFFKYCDVLLKKYKNDFQITSISGSNFGYKSDEIYSYSFTTMMNPSGWATWRREINSVDFELSNWKQMKKYKKIFYLLKSNLFNSSSGLDWGWLLHWKEIFDQIANNQFNSCWDYQWIYYQLTKKKLTIFPCENLVKNIGYDEEGTHTKQETEISTLAANNIVFPLSNNKKKKINKLFEEAYLKPKWAFYQRQKKSWHLKHELFKFYKKIFK